MLSGVIKYFVFICLILGVSTLVFAHRPCLSQEEPVLTKKFVQKKTVQVKPVKQKTGTRWNPKRPKDLLSSIPIFLNPLFSQLHFLKTNLAIEPDSVGA